MQIIDVLKSAQGGAVIAEMAKSFGLRPAETEAAIASIAGQLSDRIERNTLSRGGLADVIASLGDPRHARALEDPARITAPETTADGIRVLDQLLWTKDKSRAVAARAAAETGLDENVIKSMLPAVASLTMGALSKSAGKPLQDIVSRFGGSEAGGEMLPGPGQRPTRGPSRQIEVDDGGWSGGGGGGDGPLPLPGERPYGAPSGGGGMGGGRNPLDDLSDILRRGGFNLPGGGTPAPGGGGGGQQLPPLDLPGGVGAGGGALWNIVRGILAAALGFQSRGVIGWIIRMVVAKWGWRILQRILGGILGGARRPI